MPRIVMDRRAGDNKYLHKDFHLTADVGIQYVGENYGDEGIKEYFSDYTLSVYKPLIEKIKKDGLVALKNYLEEVYQKEEASDALSCSLNDNLLNVKVSYCPAVCYMKKQGRTPSKWYIETVRIVYDIIARESGYSFSLKFYNEEDGSTEWSVWR